MQPPYKRGSIPSKPDTKDPALRDGPIPTRALPIKPKHIPNGRPRNPNSPPLPGFYHSGGLHLKPLRGGIPPAKTYPKIRFHA